MTIFRLIVAVTLALIGVADARFFHGGSGVVLPGPNTFFVALATMSPAGNDSNPGTISQPFLTPGRAQTAARGAIAGSGCPTINFRGNPADAHFTGSITGNTLAVSGVTGTIQVGDIVSGPAGAGVAAPASTIVSGSGATWTISQPQGVGGGITPSPTAMVAYRPALYRITSTLALTSADSGVNSGCPSIWQSYSGEYAAISGGVQVSGWTLCTDAGVCGNGSTGIQQATVTTPSDFREFYVSNAHRTRAKGGFNPTGFTINNSNGALTAPSTGLYSGMASWGNPTSVEINSENMWQNTKCPVATISGSPPVISLTANCSALWVACTLYSYNHFGGIGQYWPAWIENAFELLPTSGPGSWYYNKATHVLYYYPLVGENVASADAEVPMVDKLVTGAGLANVQFNRLGFMHNSWLGPNASTGYVMWGGNGTYETNPSDCVVPVTVQNPLEPAIEFSGATLNVSLDHDIFMNNAGRSVLWHHGAQSSSVTNSQCLDNGGGCVQVGDPTDGSESNPALQTANMLTQNTAMVGEGFEYVDSSEIWQPCARNTGMDHVYFGPQPGLGTQASGCGGAATAPTYSDHNSITNTWAKDYCSGQSIWDCSGFDTFGLQATAFTANGNYAQGLASGKVAANIFFACYYPDEGSDNWSANNNVCDGPINGGQPDFVFMFWGSNVNNTFTNLYGTTNQVLDNGSGNTIAPITVFTSGSPPAGALSIIQAAGVTAGVTPGP